VRVDQFVPSFAQHDAISNHVLQIRRLLRGAGFESEIYHWELDPRIAGESRPYQDYRSDSDGVIIYHGSTDAPMAGWLAQWPGGPDRLSLDYHNITPVRFFARWQLPAAQSMHRARRQLARLAPHTGLGLADSEFNRSELVELGYHPTAVCPLLVDLDDYHREPDPRTVEKLKGRGRRWLFVGRISPNKCQHDVIASFAVYRRLFDSAATLTLIGGVTSLDYKHALQRLAAELGVEAGVEFRDGVAFTELLAHYRAADVFVCLSEHEGFCVPILEAMELGVPVIAFASTAVTDTVSSAGVLLADKDPLAVACAVDELLSDDDRRAALVEAGRARAATFSLPATSKQFLDALSSWLGAA
jgi:glycosyltransferase involved in cell wall biosynthesis